MTRTTFLGEGCFRHSKCHLVTESYWPGPPNMKSGSLGQGIMRGFGPSLPPPLLPPPTSPNGGPMSIWPLTLKQPPKIDTTRVRCYYYNSIITLLVSPRGNSDTKRRRACKNGRRRSRIASELGGRR